MSRKGLSSVIGAVLLIMVSVGAAASAWAFIDTVTSQTQDNIQNQVDEEQRSSQSELTAEIAYNGTHGYTILTLRNSGSISVPLQDENGEKTLNMYVDGRPLNGDTKSWEFTQPEKGLVALDPTESKPVNTTAEYPDDGEQYSIKFTGPYDITTTYVCYNSGTASC